MIVTYYGNTYKFMYYYSVCVKILRTQSNRSFIQSNDICFSTNKCFSRVNVCDLYNGAGRYTFGKMFNYKNNNRNIDSKCLTPEMYFMCTYILRRI